MKAPVDEAKRLAGDVAPFFGGFDKVIMSSLEVSAAQKKLLNDVKAVLKPDAKLIIFHAEGGRVELAYEAPGILEAGCPKRIDTETLGINITAEAKRTDQNNHPYIFDADIVGTARGLRPTARPVELESLTDGRIVLEY